MTKRSSLDLALSCVVCLTAAVGCGGGSDERQDASVGTGGRGGSGGSGGTAGRPGLDAASRDLRPDGSPMGGAGGARSDAGSEGEAGPRDAAALLDAALPDASPADVTPPNPPLPWRGVELGPAALSGGLGMQTPENDNDSFRIYAAGTGFRDRSDSGYFAYRAVTGSVEVMGVVTGSESQDPNALAGLMVRESPDADAAMVFVGLAGEGTTGGRIVIRKARGQEALLIPGETDMPALNALLRRGQWLRLRREGSRVFIYAGSRSVAYSEAGFVGMIDLVLASADAPVYVGAAATSGSAAVRASAVFGALKVNNLASDPVTAAWMHYDTGTVGGSAIHGPAGRLELTTSGQSWDTDAARNKEFFTFAYDPAPRGNISLVLRVGAFPATAAPEAKLGAMARYGDISNWSRSARGVGIFATAGVGVQLMHRQSGGEEVPFAVAAAKEDVRAPVWLRLDRFVRPVPNDPLGRSETLWAGFWAADGVGDRPGAWTQLGDTVQFEGGDSVASGVGVAASAFASEALLVTEVTQLEVGTASMPPLPPGPDAGVPHDPSLDGGTAVDAPADL